MIKVAQQILHKGSSTLVDRGDARCSRRIIYAVDTEQEYHMDTEQEYQLRTEGEKQEMAETLYRACVALSSTLNYEEVLDRILGQLKELASHDAASVMLIQDGIARVFRWRGYAQFSAEGSGMSLTYQIANMPTLRTMYETGQPLVISDVKNDERWVSSPNETWVKSYAGVPIRRQEQVIGFLNL